MTREQTTIRLPAELKDQLQQEAEVQGKSYNNLVELILASWVRNFLKQ